MLALVINNKWIAWISLVISVLLIFLIIQLGGGIKEYIKKQKEKSEKDKTERAQKLIQTRGKIAEKELNSFKNN